MPLTIKGCECGDAQALTAGDEQDIRGKMVRTILVVRCTTCRSEDRILKHPLGDQGEIKTQVNPPAQNILEAIQKQSERDADLEDGVKGGIANASKPKEAAEAASESESPQKAIRTTDVPPPK